MRFRILGSVEVVNDEGRPIALVGQKARALLGILLLNAGKVVPADELATRLWGETASSSSSLQVQVSRLRKTLQSANGTVPLVNRRPGYVLDVDPEDVDVGIFDRLVVEASKSAARGDPARAVEIFAEALSLWRGPVLSDAGLPSSPEVMRLEEARITAIESQIQAELACGRHKEIVSKLEALLVEHPYRERLWSAAMLALYRSDRQADALGAFHRLRTLLADELGIDPSAAVRQLHEAILRQDPTLDFAPRSADLRAATALPLPPAFTGATPPAFVGRQAELDWLTHLWRDVRAGERRLALIAGEAGIGKTRLALQVARVAHAESATVLFGRCDEEAIVPYQPFVEALRHLVMNLPDEVLDETIGGRRGSELVRLIPELRERMPDLPSSEGEDESRRYRLYEAVSSLLMEVASTGPVVLVIDDLQWADRASTQLLRHLLKPEGEGSLFAVCTYRDAAVSPHDPLADLLANLRHDRLGDRVRLEGMSFPEVGDLCRRFGADDDDVPVPGFVEALRAKTSGNPFFIEEILRHLEEVDSAGRIPWHSLSFVEEVGLPESVKEAVERRLGRLSDITKRILGLAAAVGAEFSASVLERLAEIPADDVIDALEEATAAGIVAEVQGGYARYTFRHALLRQALYERFLSIRLVRLHRRIGEVIEQLYSLDLESHLAELAHHFYLAAPGGGAEKAVEYAMRAGEQAMRKLAYEESEQYYRHALEILEETESTNERTRCEVIIAIGEAQWRTGDHLPARATFEQAMGLARKLGDEVLLARAALGFGTGFGGYGQTVRANETLIGYLEEALRALYGDDPLRVRLLTRLATEMYFTPHVERRKQLTDEAVEIADRIGDQMSLLIALHGREWATLGPDRPLEQRRKDIERVVELARELGNKEVEFLSQFLRQITFVESGDLRAADRAIESAQQLAQELRMPGFLPWVTAYRSMRASLSGRYEESDVLVSEAMEQAESLQLDPYTIMMILGGQAVTQRVSRSHMPEMIDVLRALADENPHHPVIRCTLAMFAVREGRLEAAREAIDALAVDDFAVIPRDGNWLMSMWAVGLGCAGVNDKAKARALYERLLPFADRWACSSISTCFGPVATALAMLAAVLGRFDDAERFCLQAIEQTGAQQTASLHLLAKREYAQMLYLRRAPGDDEKAGVLLDEVIDAARRLRTPVFEERAVSLRARIDARASAGS
ncbi:MAG TPA: BTAD domain-containing putative transcriptional regulator [Actinomycetota bacterium]|nr:BTAD domain-containing putative transcriptional regulator [Actinomycetota bacterium]